MVQATKMHKTDVLVIYEFNMLDIFLLWTTEGLCRKFALVHSSTEGMLSILAKVRLGICEEEVDFTLRTHIWGHH